MAVIQREWMMGMGKSCERGNLRILLWMVMGLLVGGVVGCNSNSHDRDRDQPFSFGDGPGARIDADTEKREEIAEGERAIDGPDPVSLIPSQWQRYEQVHQYLRSQSVPVTHHEILQNNPAVTSDDIDQVLATTPITPAFYSLGEEILVEVDRDFFEQKLAVTKATVGPGQNPSFHISNHQAVEVEQSTSWIRVAGGGDGEALGGGVLFFEIIEQGEERVLLRCHFQRFFEDGIASAQGRAWVRSVRFLNNFHGTPYLSVEYTLRSPQEGGGSAVVHNNLALFPRVVDGRQLDAQALQKIAQISKESFAFAPGGILSRSLRLRYVSRDSHTVTPVYLLTQEPEYFASPLGQRVLTSLAQGVESWNIYGREDKKIVRFQGLLDEGIKFGDYGYSFFALQKNIYDKTAETQISFDPHTGVITSSVSVLSTYWFYYPRLQRLHKILAQVYADRLRSGVLDQEEGSQTVVSIWPRLAMGVADHRGWSVGDMSWLRPYAVAEASSAIAETQDHSDLDLPPTTVQEVLESDEYDGSLIRLEALWEQHPHLFDLYLSAFRYVVYHETGHALGLHDNYKASSVPMDEPVRSGMDDHFAVVRVALFLDGPLAKPLAYDQSLIDALYHGDVASDIPEMEFCRQVHVVSHGREGGYRGQDPFCGRNDFLNSLAEGIKFMNTRLSYDLNVYGITIPSFVSAFNIPTVQQGQEGSGEGFEQSELPVPEAEGDLEGTYEEPQRDGPMSLSLASESADLVVMADGGGPENHEDGGDSDITNLDLEQEQEQRTHELIYRFGEALRDILVDSAPSYVDIIRSNVKVFLKWLRYQDFLETYRHGALLRHYISRHRRLHEIYRDFGLQGYQESVLSVEDLTVRSGLSRFAFPKEYEIHHDAERSLNLAMFQDVMRIATRKFGNFEVLVTPLKLSEMVCGSDAASHLNESECLSLLSAEGREVLYAVSHELLRPYRQFFESWRSIGKGEDGWPVFEGYISSDIVKEVMESLADVTVAMKNMYPELRDEVMRLVVAITDRSLVMDDFATNVVKVSLVEDVLAFLDHEERKLLDSSVVMDVASGFDSRDGFYEYQMVRKFLVKNRQILQQVSDSWRDEFSYKRIQDILAEEGEEGHGEESGASQDEGGSEAQ